MGHGIIENHFRRSHCSLNVPLDGMKLRNEMFGETILPRSRKSQQGGRGVGKSESEIGHARSVTNLPSEISISEHPLIFLST
jgi:hypothetical protein